MFWWKKWPGLLKYELKALRGAGIAYKADHDAFRRGTLHLDLWFSHAGKVYTLKARFPTAYPYSRVSVSAPELSLPRHQVPFGSKELCLIGRASVNWNTSDTLASLLTEQFPKLLKVFEEPLNASPQEEDQGEPVTDYYSYERSSMILVDSAWTVPADVLQGLLKLRLASLDEMHLRGAVTEIDDGDDHRLLAANENIVNLFGPSYSIVGRWFRMPQPVLVNHAPTALERVGARFPNALTPVWRSLNGIRFDLVGIVFPEEVAKGRFEDGWIFLVRRGEYVRGKSRRNPNRFRVCSCSFVRSGRGGISDLHARIPGYEFLHAKRVLVIGTGCIGAPMVIELARCGIGNLLLMDPDLVEPGIAVRWPLGFQYFGYSKVEALRLFINRNYPFTNVEVRQSDCWTDAPEPLGGMISNSDLVVDATAEVGVQQFVSDLCRELGRPYICVSGTPGGWGGRVARFMPEKDKPCWYCLEAALKKETVAPPPFDPTGLLQPVGCANPTFTGTAYDLCEVSLMAVRMAVSLLGQRAHLPQYDWDIATLSMRTSNSAASPRWVTEPLVHDPECRNH